eukprot:TRINITY_DN4680_c0_g1_i1.p1 TRINITY_DN4680_c0_g1~~TRINITY_DN4680_c0_g1_i1.p1  ORF type:complete len:358 (+),score=97.75 TRINITY_DN4680_c0_g1_i1:65-1138(+)
MLPRLRQMAGGVTAAIDGALPTAGWRGSALRRSPVQGAGVSEHAVHSDAEETLSRPAAVALLVFGGLVLTHFVGRTFAPLLLAPAAALCWVGLAKYAHLPTADSIIRCFALGAVAGPLVFVTQGALLIVPALLPISFLGPVGRLIFLLAESFVWVLPEEVLKYRVARERFSRGEDSRARLLGCAAVTLGYALAQPVIYAAFSSMIPKRRPFAEQLPLGFVLAVLQVPLHLLTTYAIGLSFARFKESEKQGLVLRHAEQPYRVALPVPVISRALFCLGVHKVVGVHPVLALLSLCLVALSSAAALWHIRQLELRLPPAYLAKIGYMHTLGYGNLPQVDQYEQPGRIAPAREQDQFVPV